MNKLFTWYVLSDGANAKVVRLRPGARGVEPIVVKKFYTRVQREHEVMSDRAGRGHGAVGTRRYANAGDSIHEQLQKSAFAKRLSNYLDQALADKQFENIVLVAAPKTLGDLRREFSPQVQRTVAAEFDRDYTSVPLKYLRQQLPELIA